MTDNDKTDHDPRDWGLDNAFRFHASPLRDGERNRRPRMTREEAHKLETLLREQGKIL